ncbi:hypothetical protein I3843_03G013200 [Carya illinoinensis]|nr:hypothetical protein I3760_03G009800 [Carya illinoinensis]KAG7985215.1 hypothetical protein I3843_03G013200 [Carya illinoinensis]
MEVSILFNKLRYFSNSHSHSLCSLFSHSSYPFLSPKILVSPKPSPIFCFSSNHFNTKSTSSYPYPFISSTRSSSFSAIKHPFPQSSRALDFYGYSITRHRFQISNIGVFRNYCNRFFRWFSVSSAIETMTSSENVKSGKMGINGIRPIAIRKEVLEMIAVIMRDENDLEFKLDSMNLSLSISLVTEIFRVLSWERVSALRFFAWIRSSRPDLCCNSDVCSLVIHNCGWLDDYKAMLCILNDYKLKRICLTKMAFGFLPVFVSNKDSIMHSVRRVVEVLNEVGGSCRTSGVHSLIEMLSSLGSFEMAKFVMEITERKTGYYNILIKEKCWRCDFEGAKEILDEMRQMGCDPIVNTYNYLLSSLCRSDKTDEACQLLEEMQERNCLPNPLTFEIFIYHSCRLGKFDLAIEFLDRMISNGLEPRLTTHAAFIKAYFNSLRYEEAHKYVVDSSVKHRCSSNSLYSLLASLHRKKGNVVVALNIILEMITEGLRPNFAVYMRVLKHLQKSGRDDLARDLKSRFSGLSLPSSTETQ